MLLYRNKVGGAILADEMVSAGGGLRSLGPRPHLALEALHAMWTDRTARPRLLHHEREATRAMRLHPQGLGKTSQVINYLGAIRHLESDPGPHLVVLPASLLENWQRELHRWCPAMKVCAPRRVGWHQQQLRGASCAGCQPQPVTHMLSRPIPTVCLAKQRSCSFHLRPRSIAD